VILQISSGIDGYNRTGNATHPHQSGTKSMVKTGSEKPKVGQEGAEALKRVRLLLLLWSMDGLDAPVKKSGKDGLTNAIKKKTEKVGDYQNVYEQLEREGAISAAGTEVRLTAQGLEKLRYELMNPAFEFPTSVGERTVNALLKWIREMGSEAIVRETNGNGSKPTISSYDEFEKVVMGAYDRLNRDFNLDGMVPIYRVRREIGERITRSGFDSWLLEMQANDLVQLLEGSVEDSASDKIEDSITTKVSGLRCYMKRLSE
jgi:hypothetical protein